MSSYYLWVCCLDMAHKASHFTEWVKWEVVGHNIWVLFPKYSIRTLDLGLFWSCFCVPFFPARSGNTESSVPRPQGDRPVSKDANESGLLLFSCDFTVLITQIPNIMFCTQLWQSIGQMNWNWSVIWPSDLLKCEGLHNRAALSSWSVALASQTQKYSQITLL